METVSEQTIIEHKGYKNQVFTMKDVPTGMKLVAELCGLDVVVSLMKNCGGITVAIPSNGFMELEKRIIMNEYDGSTESMQKLALKLDLHESTVRGVLRKANLEVTKGQKQLFPKGWQNKGINHHE